MKKSLSVIKYVKEQIYSNNITALRVSVCTQCYRASDWSSTTVFCPMWQDGGHQAADMDSSKLEQKFLDNPQDVVEFNAGSQSYSLCFQGKGH